MKTTDNRFYYVLHLHASKMPSGPRVKEASRCLLKPFHSVDISEQQGTKMLIIFY